MVGAGEDSGKYSEHGDEARQEDDLAAVAQEKVLAQIELALVEADPIAPEQQPAPERATDPIPDIVAENSGARRRRNDPSNLQSIMRASVKSRRDECGFSRQRDTGAFEQNDRKDRDI